MAKSQFLAEMVIQSVGDLTSPPVYALVFPNPFSKKEETFIPVDEARRQILEVIHQKFSLDSETKKLVLDEKELEHITTLVTSRIAWMRPDYPESQIAHKEFLEYAIGAVVSLIKNHLLLNTKLYYSEDQNQIICKIYASEGVLWKMAYDDDYPLLLLEDILQDPIPEDEEKSIEVSKPDFKRSPPCVSVLDTSKEWRDKYQKYNIKGQPDANGVTIFRPTDRIKLVLLLLEKTFDFPLLLQYQIMDKHFAIHDSEELTYLKSNWASFRVMLSPQPISRLRNYLGEKMAMYFAWMGLNVKMLIYPSIFGLIVFTAQHLSDRYLDDHHTSFDEVLLILFALMMSVWSTANEQVWLRKEKELAWKWDTVNYVQEEVLRPEYQAPVNRDPITGKMRKERPGKMQTIKQLVSFGVMLTFIGVVVAAVTAIFLYKATVATIPYRATLCGILNSAQIWVLNKIYTRVAAALTDWGERYTENHETENDYQDSYSIRLFCFRFVNSYISMFYIAFFKVRIYSAIQGRVSWRRLYG